jgi:hypothetical protein
MSKYTLARTTVVHGAQRLSFAWTFMHQLKVFWGTKASKMQSISLLLVPMLKECQLLILWATLVISLQVKSSMDIQRDSVILYYHLFLFRMKKFSMPWLRQKCLVAMTLLVMTQDLTPRLCQLQSMLIIVAALGLTNTALNSVFFRPHLNYIEFVHIWLTTNIGAISVSWYSQSSTCLNTPRSNKLLMPMVVAIKLMAPTFSSQMDLKTHGNG